MVVLEGDISPERVHSEMFEGYLVRAALIDHTMALKVTDNVSLAFYKLLPFGVPKERYCLR